MTYLLPAIARLLAEPGRHMAPEYGVRIVPLPPGQAGWRVAGVYHLSGQENAGNHHLYLEVRLGDGQRPLMPALVGWTWQGRRQEEPANPVCLDKSPNEAAGNIALGAGQVVSAWVEAPAPSERVEGVHTGFDDEEEGNTRFHHSFLVVWQFSDGAAQPAPIPPLPSPEQQIIVTVGGVSVYRGKPAEVRVKWG